MAELGLFPEPKILVLQGLVFLGALYSASFFIIKPSLRLFNERRRRTSGAVQGAKSLDSKADEMQKNYNEKLQLSLVEAKELRLSEVLAGQAESEAIIAQALSEAKVAFEGVESSLKAQVKVEKARLPTVVSDVTTSILGQLFSKGTLIGICFLSMANFIPQSFASGGGHIDTMDGIVWPLVQFIFFIAAVIFLGRKGFSALLNSKRDLLRTQLSEAKQAVVLAERRSAEFAAKLENLRNEIDSLRAQQVEEGIRERNKMVADAQQSAILMARDARRASQELVNKAREQLRQELIELAFIEVQKGLTSEKLQHLDKQLKTEALSQLGASKSLQLN